MRKDKRNKLIISISVIVVLITSGLLLYFYWPAISGTVNKTGYITAERGQELYNQGVQDGNKNKKELEDKILYYQNLVDQCNAKISESTKTIESLNQQIENLNTSNNNKDATIAEKEEIISRNNETIKELRSQITKLENSIEEYKALVNSLKASYEVTATFIFDNQVHKVKVVKRGECVGAIEDPTSSTSAEFKGWQVNGVDVDPQTYILEDDTIFIANTTQRHRVDYFANGEIFTTQYVTNNQTATTVDTPTLFGHTFKGWSLDGTNVIETTTYPITANTTFYAVFEEIKCTITFMVDDTVFNQQIVGYGQGITTPTNPTKTNYNFLGWSTDKTNVAQISPAFLENTTYFALFEKATLRVYQINHKTFNGAPFTITWWSNDCRMGRRFGAIFDDVYLTGDIKDGAVVITGADNLSTKYCYSTIAEINEGHKTYEFVDNDGRHIKASYKTKFTDVMKTLILADYNENNCQYLQGSNATVSWSYDIQDMLTDITVEIDGKYESWPMTIQMNFDCVGNSGNVAPAIYKSVFGFAQRLGNGSTHNLNSSETL